MWTHVRGNRYFLLGLSAGLLFGLFFGLVANSLVLGMLTWAFVGSIAGNIADHKARFAAGRHRPETRDAEVWDGG